jgi:hypothetical protein
MPVYGMWQIMYRRRCKTPPTLPSSNAFGSTSHDGLSMGGAAVYGTAHQFKKPLEMMAAMLEM